MRVLFIALAVVLVLAWAGYETRTRYPALSMVLFTLSGVLALLGLGAFYGMY